LFAFFGFVASFGIGCMVQSHSVSVALQDSLGVNVWITGLLLMVFTAFVIIGGIKRIALITGKLVPFMCILYFSLH